MAKVLVVDDRVANRELIVTLLKHAGHRSIEAGDGSAALEQVRAHRPELVVCDILMPTMDGYEFVRQLRTDPVIAHTEVIFYTAVFMEREARELARSCGVAHLLFKPCEPEQILLTVEKALASSAGGETLPGDTDFDREHLRLVTDKLALKVDELETVNSRLSALTDLNLQLASQRDPEVLLDRVCRGARELIGVRYAVLAVRGRTSSELPRVATWGLAAAHAERLKSVSLESGVLGHVMSEGRARRLMNPGGDPVTAGLSAHFPSMRSGLIAPIVSLHRTYGWIFLADKLGADAFSDDDERIIAIHAAQAGRIYENGSLYTEVKRVAEELRLANETLEERVRQRTAELHAIIAGLESFNRSVSHDLRGPLGGIAGAARLAREYLASGEQERADRLVQAIAAQAEVSEKAVSALLALARTAEASLQRRRIDMTALVREVVESMHHAGHSAPLPVTLLPLAEIDADPELVRQVFVNLIGNALKFSSDRQQPQVEVGMSDGHADPVIFVRDNGVGFSNSEAGRLFEPFQRLHGSHFAGSGVGLSIVKRIVARHGGKVWAESRPGQGATFFVSFGASAAPPATA